MSAFANAVAIRRMKHSAKHRKEKALPTLKLALHRMDGSITHIDAPPPPPERYVFLHVHAVDTDWYFEPLPPPAPATDFIDGATIFDEGVGSIFAEQPDTPLKLVHMPADVRNAHHETVYPQKSASNPDAQGGTNAETAQNVHASPSHDDRAQIDPMTGMSEDDLAAIAAIEKDRLERAKDKPAQPATTPVAKQQPVVHAQQPTFTGPKDWAANLLKQMKKDQ
jgi:hypothetical protein